jgi:hypothetical protein
MGFKYSYNIDTAVREIHTAAWEASDPRSDGYTQWGAKQDLYRLKWVLEDALRGCPPFSGEQEWVREQEKKKVMKILSESDNE